MIKIFKHLQGKDWLLIMCSLVFIIAQVWLDLKLPDYMYEITMLVQTEESKMSEVLVQGGYMLLCAVGSMIAAMITGFFAAKVAAGFSVRLRGMVFEKTMSFSMEEINGFSTSSLITRSTNDITQIQLLIATGLQVLVKAPILAVWAVFKIMGKSWEWTAATGFAVLFLIVMLTSVALI